MILRGKIPPRTSPARVVPALRAMSSSQARKAHLLVPAPENLQTLQYIDLTSFSDSLQDSPKDKHLDSEDPFDPLDLVGLPTFLPSPLAHSSPRRAEAPTLRLAESQRLSLPERHAPGFPDCNDLAGSLLKTKSILGTLGARDARAPAINAGSRAPVMMSPSDAKSGSSTVTLDPIKTLRQPLEVKADPRQAGSASPVKRKPFKTSRESSVLQNMTMVNLDKPVKLQHLNTVKIENLLKLQNLNTVKLENPMELHLNPVKLENPMKLQTHLMKSESLAGLESPVQSPSQTSAQFLSRKAIEEHPSAYLPSQPLTSGSESNPQLLAQSKSRFSSQAADPISFCPTARAICSGPSTTTGMEPFIVIPDSNSPRSSVQISPRRGLDAISPRRYSDQDPIERHPNHYSICNPEQHSIQRSPDERSPQRKTSASVYQKSPDISSLQKSLETLPLLKGPLNQVGSRRSISPVNSPFKKPRFNYPIACSPPLKSTQVRSYFSQEQMRGFNTVAKERPSPQLRFAYPIIQLATQKQAPGLQDSISELAELERKRVRPMLLSREQQRVIDLALKGKSLFFTGSAGTGKSVLLKEMIKALKQKYMPGEVAVTASTGLAGFHIGGMTLHSFAGIGISDGDAAATLKMVRRNRKAVARWKSTKVLIVDEISMIDGRLFDKLDFVARSIRRKRDVPFGGMQVVLCGDFYQLPPVSKNEVNKDGTETKDSALFAFESVAWAQTISASITLTEVFRQKGDDQFIDMLNDMRHGVVKPDTEAEFLRLSRPLDSSDGIVPTELYATRFEVDKANNSKLAALEGVSMLYMAKDGGTLPDVAREKLLRNFLAPSKLFLKENAQVMCIKNFDETLVNGSVGRVIGFFDRDVYHGRRLMALEPHLSFEEMVNRLSKEKVAALLSKKLGKTVTCDEISEQQHGALIKQLQESLDNVFHFMSEGEAVAAPGMSQELPVEVQSGDESYYEVSAEDDPRRAFRDNQRRKRDFINKLEQSSQGQKHPLVRFKCLDGVTTRDVLVEPERWEITDETTEEVLVYRVQFPLMLAWALSIHKSQGQTLSMVKVDLSRTFENGQAYVALSRASSRDGLQVINFRKHRVRCHPIVDTFYQSLQTTQDVEDEV